jgi:ParB family transcriptional regulator, chromosome partitioning protein
MKLEHHLVRVSLEDLDWQDRSFAIPSFTRNAFLHDSLGRHGVLCPPWLLQTERGFPVIVDGFKRLRWLKKAGMADVECVQFGVATDPRELMVWRLEAKISGAPLNLAEKAQIVARLAELMPHQRLIEDYFPVLGLAARPRAIDTWSRVASAEQLFLSALAHDRLCERAALELIDWPPVERQGMIALFCELRCSASIQMEIVERIGEIAFVQERTRADLIATQEVQDVMRDAERNHRQKTQALRDLLQRWQFPRLWSRQERFQRDLEACHLPSALRVQPPAAFEGDSWQLQIRFSSPQELAGLLISAQALAASPKLPELLGRSSPGCATAENKTNRD